MTSPKISVLIPTYNYARYLPEAIDSVLAQDFEDYELIVSDDCSSDKTEEVMARYANDSRIRYHRQHANLGMVENWNWCLSEARGEFIKFIFGDDKISAPDSLTKLLQLIESHSSATLAACARHLIDCESEILDTWNDLNRTGCYHGRDVIYRCLDKNRNLIGEPTVTLFRRRDADTGFSPRYRQLVDLEFWFRFLEKGDLAYSSDPLCSFRQHALQQTQKNNATGISDLESLWLFEDYGYKVDGIKGNLLWRRFNNLYYLRKRRKQEGGLSKEMAGMEKSLSERISRSRYVTYWVCRKARRLIKNLISLITRCDRCKKNQRNWKLSHRG